MKSIKYRVLVIAGSDSGGGAGIQADIKTINALGGYPMTAITSLTAQNTRKIYHMTAVPHKMVASQMISAFEDVGVDVIKIGMLGNRQNISAIVKVLKKKKFSGKIVIDPILKSTTGVRLISRDAIGSLKKKLFPLASVVTPNVFEAETLSGVAISDPQSIKKAAHQILDLGPESVLITGYAARKGYLSDILVGKNGTRVMEYKKVRFSGAHGTGCTLSSAIAVGLAKGMTILRAYNSGFTFVQSSIKKAHFSKDKHAYLAQR